MYPNGEIKSEQTSGGSDAGTDAIPHSHGRSHSGASAFPSGHVGADIPAGWGPAGDGKAFSGWDEKGEDGFLTAFVPASRVSLFKSFQPVLNYWEMKPNQYEAKLHELALQDVESVAAFVPWSHLETDIYHSLQKFLKAAAQVKMRVRLYVMPELGVPYPNCGIPRDLLQNPSNLAVDRRGQMILNHAAPNLFALPSFFSGEVLKRFGSYLIKFGGVLADVFSEVGHSNFVEVVVSNSLLNYYRSFGMSAGDHGDYAPSHITAFREFLDREFSGPGAEGFKMQAFETQNRHRFFAHMERRLREKTEMIFAKKKSRCPVLHRDFCNPECVPENGYHSLLSELYQQPASAERFYQAIVAAGERGETIFLNPTGVYRRFTDQEKQFLLTSAFIHTGAVTLDHVDVLKFPQVFQRKLEDLMALIQREGFIPHRRMTYLATSKFGVDSKIYGDLAAMAPGTVRLATDVATEYFDHAMAHGESSSAPGLSEESFRAQVDRHNRRFLFIDPQVTLRTADLTQLFSLAQGGKVVAIPIPVPQSPSYLPEAAQMLAKFRRIRQGLKVSLGISYEVYETDLGYIVLYDSFTGATSAARREFFQALFGLADIRSVSRVHDGRVHPVHYVSEQDSSQRLLFLVNSSRDAVTTQVTFSETVGLSGIGSSGKAEDAGSSVVGRSFEVQVPPLGVLSMRLFEPSAAQLAEAGEGNTQMRPSKAAASQELSSRQTASHRGPSGPQGDPLWN